MVLEKSVISSPLLEQFPGYNLLAPRSDHKVYPLAYTSSICKGVIDFVLNFAFLNSTFQLPLWL